MFDARYLPGQRYVTSYIIKKKKRKKKKKGSIEAAVDREQLFFVWLSTSRKADERYVSPRFISAVTRAPEAETRHLWKICENRNRWSLDTASAKIERPLRNKRLRTATQSDGAIFPGNLNQGLMNNHYRVNTTIG